jgi:uncharacterized protein (TIGR02147 family)
MMTQHQLFTFNNYRDFLNDFLLKKKSINRHFSLGLWAKDLGLSSTASLSRILNGQRSPGKDITEKLVDYFKFRKKEREYFVHLILLEKAHEDDDLRGLVVDKLRKLHPHKSFKLVKQDTFAAMSHWYYFAIREMVNLPHFKEDATWIRTQLNFKVELKAIEKAITTLLELGLLSRNKEGRLMQIEPHMDWGNDVSNEASKRNHEQNLDHAKKALRDIDLELREFNSVCMNVKQSDLPAFKDSIRAFKREMIDRFEATAGDHTYQLQLQLFPYTKTNSEPLH